MVWAPVTLGAVAATGAAGLGAYAGCYLLFGATADERRLYGRVTANTLASMLAQTERILKHKREKQAAPADDRTPNDGRETARNR
jgi:hypothetical protein